jgi:hypothetical protein
MNGIATGPFSDSSCKSTVPSSNDRPARHPIRALVSRCRGLVPFQAVSLFQSPRTSTAWTQPWPVGAPEAFSKRQQGLKILASTVQFGPPGTTPKSASVKGSQTFNSFQSQPGIPYSACYLLPWPWMPRRFWRTHIHPRSLASSSVSV